MTPAEHERAKKIASVALSRAMAGDLDDAAQYVARLNRTPGLLVAIVAWIDTYIARMYPDHQPGERIAITWLFMPEDRLESADEVSPSMRWAGRLIGMRAADDEDAFYSVLHSAPEGAALGDGIMALLHVVAHGLGNRDEVHAAEARYRSAGGAVEHPGGQP